MPAQLPDYLYPVAFVSRPKDPDNPTETLEGFYVVSADLIKSYAGPLKTVALTPVILPVTQDSGFTRVAIRAQMQGGTEVLQKVLHGLETARPLLFVDNLTIRSQLIRKRVRGSREVSTTLRMTTVFELAGYMRDEAG